MAQITLINPPTVMVMSTLSYQNTIPPLGLAYLSAAAKGAGHQVQVIDAPGEAIDAFHPLEGAIDDLYIHGLTPDEIVMRIDPGSDAVGISHMFMHAWPLVRSLVAKIRKSFPDILIVLGGETPTSMWSHLMSRAPSIDLCVLGEGENVLIDLLDAVDSGTPWNAVAGLAFRDEAHGPVRSEGARKRETNPDAFGRPDWDAFKVDAYLSRAFSSGVNRGRSMPMLATRGCPYRCTFCSSPQMWTTRYVMRDPISVVDEVEDYVRRYRINNVDFLDLTFIINRRWILKFCDELARRNVKISWQLPSGTRSEAIDFEVAQALYRSGCRNIAYSPETGSPRMLKIIKKRVNLDNLVESIEGSVRAGMVVSCAIILGLPGEGWRDIWQSYKLVLRLIVKGLHSANVQLFAPYPGSELFNLLREDGALKITEQYYYFTLARYSLGKEFRAGKSYVSYSDINGNVLLLTLFFFLCTSWGLQFLLRPWRLVRTISQLFKQDSERTVMDKLLHAQFASRKRRKKAGIPVSIALQPETANR